MDFWSSGVTMEIAVPARPARPVIHLPVGSKVRVSAPVLVLAGVSHDAKGKVGYPFQDEEDSAGIPYIPRGQPTTGSA